MNDISQLPQQQEEPSMIQPAPVPTMVSVSGMVDPAGARQVVLQFSTPSGLSVFFLDAAAAKKISNDIASVATGIVLA